MSNTTSSPIDGIRDLYKPVQPAVKETTAHVTYSEFLPTASLRPFIYCYWQLKTTQPLHEPFHYRVVADGCIDIFFELGNPSESYVMGFCKKYTEFPLESSFQYIGIRFLPTMFPQLFHIDASELSNKFQDLRNVIPKTAEFIGNHLEGLPDTDQVKQLFDTYFVRHLSTLNFNHDLRFYEAVNTILKHDGVLNVESDLDTGISTRQLRRLFNYYIGDSAKTFAKVVRFQNILRAKPSVQSLRQNKLFFDAGYYDQAHFIKEFKNFYGVTPSKAFGR